MEGNLETWGTAGDKNAKIPGMLNAQTPVMVTSGRLQPMGSDNSCCN